MRDKQVTLGARVPLSVAGLKLRLSYWGVRNLVMRGEIEGARDEYGRWFVDREALEEAMRARGLSPSSST